MTKLPGRIFAMTFAIIFFASAAAFAVFVIYDTVQSHKNSNASTDTTTQDSSTQACAEDTQKEAILKSPEVYKTTSKVTSLQLTDLAEGTGAAAKSGECVTVQYYGTLASNGKVFDQNYTTSNGFTFQLGKGQVIEGWDKGVAGMKPGGVRRLVIPATQAYGEASPSEDIPANSDLVFVVKLLRIQS